jgi:hypothetical protein
LKYNDPTGQEENLVGGGTVINNSSQVIYIAFDADQMGKGGTNLDVVIPLNPGESSETFTYDADAVIVASGQSISGATEGSFKISAGSVEIEDKNGKLVFIGNATYRAMKNRENPADRSGYQPNKQTPQQWQITKTQAGMERDRQITAATRESRERRAWERKRKELWDKIKKLFK